MSQCSVCSQSFTLKKNLYQHMRKKHNLEPEVPGKIICPFSCIEKFRTHKELRNHLESFHQQTLESEIQEFTDYETFETWKKRLEATSGYAYIRRISEKLLRKGDFKTHFICHRSGVYRSLSKGHRKLKKAGSNKIGTTCPSIMEVSRSLNDGKVRVTYWKTHFGHDPDIARANRHKVVQDRNAAILPFEVCAVLPAAGTGERMGIDVPKQYIPIHKKPIICYTVEAFLRIPFVKKVVVVAAPESLDLMLQTLSQMCAVQGEKLMVTEGATSRHQSIEFGLKALQTCDIVPDVVIIHDGVRPFFTQDIVRSVVLAAKEHGAAGVTCPLVSTVISADDKGFLESSLDRNKYKASEMPQAFRYDLISKAYAESSPYDLEYGTECLHLVQKYTNVKAKLLPGTSNLWKVTHRKDIYTTSALVKENQCVGIINSNPAPIFLPFLKMSLSKKFKSVHLGKYNEKTLHNFPNLVFIQCDKNPYDVIEQMNIISNGQKLTQLTSIVNVFYHEYDTSINFLELQKQAKSSAKILESSNILVYYIMWEKSDGEDTFVEKTELISSLLFDSNSFISGTIFLS